MDDADNPKRRVQFLRNEKLMRKRGTARGRRSIAVAKAAERAFPLTSLPPIERYRRMMREECSRTLSENIRAEKLAVHRDVMMVHHITEAIMNILRHERNDNGRHTTH